MHNPYITDRPLSDQDLFFGREKELANLALALGGEQRLFLLYGQRRIGKTSFLAQLPTYLGAEFRVIRLDWEEIPTEFHHPLDRVFGTIGHALGWPAPQPATEGDAAYYRAYLAEQLASLATGPKPLICLDSIPAPCCAPGSGWGACLHALADLLRGQQLWVLLAIEARPEECEPSDAVPNPVVLGGLSLEETENLLLMSTRGQLTYDLDSMRHIHALTGGEPYLVQLFGQILFDLRAHRGWVSMAEVDAVVPTVIMQGEPQFAEIWSRSDTATRLVLCVFAEGPGTHGISSADDIQRRLARQRIEMPMGDIQRALAELERRGLVERLGGGLFRFRSALLLQWLRANKSALETARRSREYHLIPRPSTPPFLNRRIDWLGLGLWLVIAALIIAIGSVWRNRELRIIWTDQPPTQEPSAPTGSAPLVVPTPEHDLPMGRIAYMAKPDSGQYWDIYTMTSEGLDPRRLTEIEADDMLPSWSPDGERIAFVSDRDGNREIYMMNADGSDQQNLTHHGAEDWTPSWSPDGSQIAFASFRDNNWEIYMMNADGSNQRRITNSPAADYSPAWSPDGEWIAFVSDRTGNLEIFVMRPDGSELRQFTDDPATDQAPNWSPDGRQLLWESYRYGNMEILITDLHEGGEPRNLSQDTYADDHGPSMSPSGQRVAYFTNRDGGWDIATLDLQTGERANLTQSLMIEQYPAWAP